MTDRESFEAWASQDFYSGLADVADTWDAERQTYTDFAHHMAWCAWRAATAYERKECAKVCDGLDAMSRDPMVAFGTAQECAEAIRQRGSE